MPTSSKLAPFTLSLLLRNDNWEAVAVMVGYPLLDSSVVASNELIEPGVVPSMHVPEWLQLLQHQVSAWYSGFAAGRHAEESLSERYYPCGSCVGHSGRLLQLW